MARMKWKYEIGDRIIDYKEDGSLKRDLTIIDKRIEIKKETNKKAANGFCNKTRKYYKYYCNVCGWDNGWIEERHLNRPQGCSCCGGRTIVKGINDVATSHPHLVQYFKNEDDAYLYSAYSNCRIDFICPFCGCKKSQLISTLTRYGFNCPECSDGVSYPEKFINAFLKQLNVEYKPQLTCATYEWCDNYRYDFWFKYNDEEYIIETHGIQHYKDSFNKFGGRTLKEEQDNDKKKKKLANKNGFDNNHYIVLDCRYSELKWIKKSIIKSDLSKIFNLSVINWPTCHEKGLESIVKEVCQYWEDNKSFNISPIDVVKHFQLGKTTVLRYLNAGKKLGWCTYDASEESKKHSHSQEKKVISLDKNMNIVGVFNSSKEVEEKSIDCFGVQLKRKSILLICLRKDNHYYKKYGYYFWYLEDYLKEHNNFEYSEFLKISV